MTMHNADCCYGDLLYVDKNHPEKTRRYWKSSPYSDGLFQKGWMPPHPTFFVKREVYNKYGVFNTDFKIAADYELMLRFLVKHKLPSQYIPAVLINMRVGGKSNGTFKSIVRTTFEDYRAWRTNNLRRKFITILIKKLSKIPQFLKRPQKELQPDYQCSIIGK
jgi:hypothetical protein